MYDLLNYKKSKIQFIISKFCKMIDGGKGSGNFGHVGRKGKVGGSGKSNNNTVQYSINSQTDIENNIIKEAQESIKQDLKNKRPLKKINSNIDNIGNINVEHNGIKKKAGKILKKYMQAKEFIRVGTDENDTVNIFFDTKMNDINEDTRTNIIAGMDEVIQCLKELYPSKKLKKRIEIYFDTMNNENYAGLFSTPNDFITVEKGYYLQTKKDADVDSADKQHVNAYKNTILHELIHKMEMETNRLHHQTSGMREWVACSNSLLYYNSFKDYEISRRPFNNVYYFSNKFARYIIDKYGKETILKMNRQAKGDLWARFVKATKEKDTQKVLKDFLQSINWDSDEPAIRKKCKGDRSEENKFKAALDLMREFGILLN